MPLLTGKTISDLPSGSGLTDDSLIEVENESGFSTKIRLADLAAYVRVTESIVPTNLPWRGVIFSKTADSTGVTFPMLVPLTGGLQVDTDNMVNSLEVTEMIVPAGVTKVRVMALIKFTAATTAGAYSAAVQLNGNTVASVATRFGTTGFSNNDVQVDSGVFDVAEGDVITVRANASLAATNSLLAGTMVNLEIVEG